jgi:hypothetical protein
LVDKRGCTIELLYEFLKKINTSLVEAKKFEFNSSLRDKTKMVLIMGMVPSTHPCDYFVTHPLWRKNDGSMAKKSHESWIFMLMQIFQELLIKIQYKMNCCNFFAKKDNLMEKLPYFET